MMFLFLSDWLNKIHSRLPPQDCNVEYLDTKGSQALYGRLSPRLIDRLTTYLQGILTIVDGHLYHSLNLASCQWIILPIA